MSDNDFLPWVRLGIAVVKRARSDAEGRGIVSYEGMSRNQIREDAEAFIAEGYGALGDFVDDLHVPSRNENRRHRSPRRM